ncbi:RNA ligase family protein [Haliscomenobacter hydrossis]|uniref:RNA ligase domain-containing protein n=1 Tax=Haliscomenobacter hydrossis (strain ATCC 27775 / DSM 1100 / LMG 10767 / O) TaxID=760192 RepID=F4KU01_HALH1|nr:RNA ligase family protein [Haliscomenobacter hydrossis]AEE49137.1 hypothetical protein Halhy_1242 [Haliscomenobacter hydrossis DSM 1100]
MAKPLGHKSYGSIPHLPGSRLGSGDHHCPEGQARIALEQTRDAKDLIIVQEKLDGSNVGIAKLNGDIIPLVRSGHHANTSPYAQHHHFAQWVQSRKKLFESVLLEGERLCGEWLLQAHGTRYDLAGREPFVAFDLLYNRHERVIFEELQSRLDRVEVAIVPTVYVGHQALPIAQAMHLLQESHYGAIDPVEGAIWRVEREGKVEFLAKYVRPDKIDGRYLPEVTGNGHSIWNLSMTIL